MFMLYEVLLRVLCKDHGESDGPSIGWDHLCKPSRIGAPAVNMQRSRMCSVAASLQARMTSSATCCICRWLKGFVFSPTSHMQIIVGCMLLTTPLIALASASMLVHVVFCIQSMFTHTHTACRHLCHSTVLCSSSRLVMQSSTLLCSSSQVAFRCSTLK